MSRALPTGLARYRDVVLGRPRGVSALPQPYDVPRIVATAFKGVQIAQELSRFWLWGLPAAAAGLWMTYPAMSEPVSDSHNRSHTLTLAAGDEQDR